MFDAGKISHASVAHGFNIALNDCHLKMAIFPDKRGKIRLFENYDITLLRAIHKENSKFYNLLWMKRILETTVTE
jgi:hypothetical protein